MAQDVYRLLLVEDNPGDARLIRELLAEAGAARFEVTWAKSLGEGLEQLALEAFAVVLLDLTLPDSRGLDTFRQLHALAAGVPVVVLTGLDDRRLALEAVRCGAQDYLVKGEVGPELLARAARYAVERGAAERALGESQRLARATLDALGAHIAILGEDGTILSANRRWSDFARRNGLADDQVGRNYLEVCDRARGDGAEEAARAAAGLRAVAAGEAPEFLLEYACHGPDVRRWFLLRADRFPGPGPVRLAVAHEEVTERRLAREALAESEARYRSLVDLSPDAVLTRTRGRIAFANPAAVRLLGAAGPADLVGQPVQRFIHPGDREALRSRVARTEDLGRSFHGEEQRVVGLDGETRTVEASGVSFAQGGEPGALVVLRDVSERKKLEAQLRQAQKMEAVGRLAGGVAHDFNNLLQVILGSAEIALDGAEPDGPLAKRLVDVRRAAERAADLTRQLLAFSRKQIVEPVVLDLNAVVRETEKMLRRLIGEDVDLAARLAPDLAPVRADPGQVEQILMNLAINARDAMPGGGRLTLETANVVLDEAYAREHPSVTPGPHVLLAVSDTGTGMGPEVLAHVFEPFFTTKERGKGTGLGLATVYGIVKQAGGHVWVYSEPGHGTAFKVYFPRAEGRAETRALPVDEAPLLGSETVLVVEDEAVVRDLVRCILTGRGYRVVDAPNPAEALGICRSMPEPVHLLLTDVVMPGMGGRQLAERLAAERPGLKVLYMSGYLDNAIVHHGVLDPGVHFLQKPFTPLALARKVRQVLDG
ncbi:MAG: response regulator [Deferrisomatales bacterium]